MWQGCEHLRALKANCALYPLLGSLFQVVKCGKRIPEHLLLPADPTNAASTIVCLSCLMHAQNSGKYASPIDALVAVVDAAQADGQGLCTDETHTLAVQLLPSGFRPMCLKCDALIDDYELDRACVHVSATAVRCKHLSPDDVIYPAGAGLRGIANLGNTCFMNSIMQILVRVPELRDHFLLGEHHSQCRVAQLSAQGPPERSNNNNNNNNNSAKASCDEQDPEAWGRPWTMTSASAKSTSAAVDVDGIGVAVGNGGNKVRMLSGNTSGRVGEGGLSLPVCFGCEFAAVLGEMYCSATPLGESLVATTMLHALWVHSPMLAGYLQQDAHEFYHTFVDALHLHCFKAPETLHLPIPKGQHSAGVSARSDPTHTHTTSSATNAYTTSSKDAHCDCIVHSTFGGVQLSRLSCTNCGTQSNSYERFFDISLHIGNPSNSSKNKNNKNKNNSSTTDTSPVTDAVSASSTAERVPSNATSSLSPTPNASAAAAHINGNAASAQLNGHVVAADTAVPMETEPTTPTNNEPQQEEQKQQQTSDLLSLSDLVQRYVAKEDLVGTERVACSKCSSREEASRHLSFQVLPPVMCFQLKRFRFQPSAGKYIKDNTPVTFPAKGLDLGPCSSGRCALHGNSGGGSNGSIGKHISEMSSSGDVGCECFLYDLTAIVHHSGTMEGGHYMGFIKQDGVWFLCEDENVSRVSEETVLGCQAYLLFYRARTDAEIPSSSCSSNSISSSVSE